MLKQLPLSAPGLLGSLLAAAALLLASPAAPLAQELPKSLTWTAYGSTSSGYAQAVAIGNMLKKNHGTSLRVLPGKNDVSRMTPLRTGRVDMCACGIASYFAQEGALLFAQPGWGPQPMRMLLTSIGSFGLGLSVAKDSGVRSYADLKGKRVAFVKGGDALNKGAEAFLAYGGLTWEDLKVVTYGGFRETMNGMLNGQIDAAFSSTVTPLLRQLATSPRGVHWPAMSANAGSGNWQRLLAVAPYFQPHRATSGAEISKAKPWQGAGYPYPILVANADYSTPAVEILVESMIKNYGEYKDAAPGANGWALANQNLRWVLPYHAGAVRYFKRIGKWGSAEEKHQQGLLERQKILAAAWERFNQGYPPNEKEAFKTAWLKTRKSALQAKSLPVVFE